MTNLNDRLKLFSGSSHPALAQRICDWLDIPLGQARIDRFANDNLFVQIEENVREKDVFVLQTSCPPVNEHLVELYMMIDALRHASARRITAIIPYYFYVRSDKKDMPRISITARLVADLLATSGANRVLTMTLHSDQIQGFFRTPSDQLSAIPLICDYFREWDLSDFVVVAPDAGSARRAGAYASRLGLPMAIGDKRRLSDTEVEIHSIVGDVRGKKAIIFDDEIATGGSMLKLAKYLEERCEVDEVYAGAAHGVLVPPALERLSQPPFRRTVVTDSLPLPEGAPEARIEQVSVCELFGKAIHAIHTGESVSSLFR
ncbi:MAG: ribose-phosphate pyrophosphokinase [candidate division WS1 bacterium]|jgi:ribose-phosphate pyrophosphokinase|nr:ribose-phosphate pyrophosphokinase [candidate division WS1 bacterium]